MNKFLNIEKKFEKRGILVAFGELFLKSEGVRRIFRQKLENNIFSALKKVNITYKNNLSRDRIFVELKVYKFLLKK